MQTLQRSFEVRLLQCIAGMRAVAVGVLLTCMVSRGATASAQDRQAGCSERALLFESGSQTGAICTDQARVDGYTVIDLSDDWVPQVLSEPTDPPEALRQPYRETYIALADEQRLESDELDASERHLELLGIFPSFRVLRERLLDRATHACHDAVPDEPLAALDRTLSPWRPDLATQRSRVERVRKEELFLERERIRRKLEDIAALAGVPGYAYLVRRHRRDRAVVAAIASAQDHLVCSRALSQKHERGVFDAATANALRAFAAEHMAISSGALVPATRALFVADSRELVFRASLRALRERIAAATSVIEDGSAAGRFGKVLGRDLDPAELQAVAAFGALADGADDLLSPLTEAAARALGWTDPEALARFFDEREPQVTRKLMVAVRLPELPLYYGPHMELRAEIDRGDVWYAYPYRTDGSARPMPVAQRPTLVLYARVADRWKPLARYLTTIGGWQREQLPSGMIGLRYKESPVGRRMWRDLVAAPAWLPPSTTPDAELLRRDAAGRYHAKRELLGPGYRSAYGLAMLVHLKARAEQPSGPVEDDASCVDQGVRTHGSVSYVSILRGYSHGCHRLFNHLALRLMGFLLAHRHHVRHGNMPVRYDRTVARDSELHELHVRSRGYRYELAPAVPVEVLEGRIRGPVKRPIRGLRPLSESFLKSHDSDR